MTLTRYLPRIAAVPGPDGRRLYLVGELHGGRQFLAWTAVPFPEMGGHLAKGGPSQGTPAGAETPGADWKWVHEIREESAPTKRVAGTLRQPSLAALGKQLLLAGDCYRSARAPHEVWVAALAEPRDRAIDGVFLGPGWKPTLMSAANTLFCFAVDKEDSRAYGDVPGRLVAWKSSDAEKWEPWAPGVLLDNVVRVDACNEGDTTLVACLTAAPEPRIHVYRLDPEKEGLAELLTIDPAPEGELGQDIAIRLLKGEAYLFWQDHVGAPMADMLDKDKAAEGKTYIVMRRLDLPADD